MARPRKYDTPEKLDKAIDAYFTKAEENKDNIPTWPDMLLSLGISADTAYSYSINKDNKYTGFSEPIKKAELRLASTLLQLGREKPNLQPLVIFLLKQPHNGGYRDKPKDDPTHTVSLDIKISGCDGFDPGA